ncbi:MAG: NTP transferase domain-containing protein [Deltaproteobacteria bacterium]|nr:NTP transferase domain-containing protein [Deltaproteobacteria bacterium]
MNLSAIILAAGEGRRIGVPKAILKIGTSFLADIQYEFLSCCKFQKIVIVIGAEAAVVKECLKYSKYAVVNSNYHLGQFSSLIKGICSVDSCRGVLVLPVDVYPLEKLVLDRLVNEVDESFDAVVPVNYGRRGHPVILLDRLVRRLAKYDVKDSRLDFILRECRVKEVYVNSKSIFYNINTLDNLEKLNIS